MKLFVLCLQLIQNDQFLFPWGQKGDIKGISIKKKYRVVKSSHWLIPGMSQKMCEIVIHKVAAGLKTSVSVKIRVARSGWQRDPCGWNERGGVVSNLGRDVWFDGVTTISRVSLPMTSVCEGWTTGWLSCPQCHKRFRLYRIFLPPYAWRMMGHVSNKRNLVNCVQPMRWNEKGNGTEERLGITFIKCLA